MNTFPYIDRRNAMIDTAAQQLTLLRAHRTALPQQKRGLRERLLTVELRVKVSQGGMRLN